MTQAAPWPYGKDQTCLARIHPGNAQTNTPKTLSFGGVLTISKAPDGNRNPRSGWMIVKREHHTILSQETDPASGLPVIQFMRDPKTPEAVAGRQAAQRARVREIVGVDEDEIAARVTENVVKALQGAGVLPQAPSPEPTSEEPASAEPSEEALPSDPEPPEEETLSLADEEPAPTPKTTRKRKGRSKKKKSSSRLRLSEEG